MFEHITYTQACAYTLYHYVRLQCIFLCDLIHRHLSLSSPVLLCLCLSLCCLFPSSSIDILLNLLIILVLKMKGYETVCMPSTTLILFKYCVETLKLIAVLLLSFGSLVSFLADNLKLRSLKTFSRP